MELIYYRSIGTPYKRWQEHFGKEIAKPVAKRERMGFGENRFAHKKGEKRFSEKPGVFGESVRFARIFLAGISRNWPEFAAVRLRARAGLGL